MSSFLVGLFLVLAGFGGGYFTGSHCQKRKANAEILEILKDAEILQNEMSAKIDSLQKLPKKVDTVIINTETIIEKTDTLILLNYRIFENTDTIKNELRNFINKK